jgi:hypothetical protein
MNEEHFLAIKRLFYFVYEAIAGLGIIFVMLIASLAAGTWLISSFGDVGGFIWLGITYLEFLAFYPIYNRILESMRKYMP